MRQIMTVFSFTYRDGVRKKAFIITTVVMLAAILLLCSVPRVLVAFTEGNVDSIVEGTFYTCYIYDGTGKFDGCGERLSKALPDTEFRNIDRQDTEKRDEVLEIIKNDAKIAMILISDGENDTPVVNIHTKDFLNGVASNSSKVSAVLDEIYASYLLRSEGVPQELIDKAQAGLEINVNNLGGLTLSGYAVGILLITLTFFAVYYYGYGVSASVASEKSTRVMETLIVSAPPKKILIGKVLGMGAVGLTQFGGVIAFAAICWKLLIPEDFEFMGERLSLDAFTPQSALLILVFFILGYLLYAFMNAISGALVDKIEDLNSAMMPVMLISMGAFYLSYFTAIMGTTYDYLVNLSMYIPFSAPFIMPFVLLNGEVELWQILLSLGILTLMLTATAIFSMKMYTRSVMHYGKRLKLKDAIKRK